jgi:hypothetical protein
MNPEEVSRFEEELKNSPLLQNELDDCRKLVNKYNEAKEVPIDRDYFVNLLPEFRMKISTNRKFKFHPAIGYGLISVVIILLFSIIILNDGGDTTQTEDIVSSMNESETEYILDNYSGQDLSLEVVGNNSETYDSVLTNLIAENLVSGNSDLNYVIENIDNNFYNLAGGITESQAEIIYNELINKKFF